MNTTRAVVDGKAKSSLKSANLAFQESLKKAQDLNITAEDLEKSSISPKEWDLFASISELFFVSLKGAHYAKKTWDEMSIEEYFGVFYKISEVERGSIWADLKIGNQENYALGLASTIRAWKALNSSVHSFEYVNEKFTLANKPQLTLGPDSYPIAQTCCPDCSTHESIACYIAHFLKRRDDAQDLRALYNVALKVPGMKLDEYILSGNEQALTLLICHQVRRSIGEFLSAKLIDPHGAYTMLREYIRSAIAEFHPKKPGFNWYACYVAFVQSSGWGKTRLCMELKKDFYLFYICIRDEASSGDPPRSQIADLIDKLQTMEEFMMFICAIYQVFLDHAVSKSSFLRDGWETFSSYVIEDSRLGNTFWAQVEKRYCDKELWSKINEYSGTGDSITAQNSTAPTDVHRINDYIVHIWDKIRDSLAGLEKEFAKERAKPLLENFVFVLDEASSLFKNRSDPTSASYSKVRFYEWRRAISYLKVPVFFILIDTSSKISNFAPSVQLDHSSRILQGQNLFMPLYALSVRGVLTAPEKAAMYYVDCATKEALDAKYKKLRFYPAKLAEQCRPLILKYFEAYVKTEPTVMEAMTQTIVFAESKMINGGVFASNMTITNSEHRMNIMTILCCRWAIRPLAFTTAEGMTARNMATCVYINRERDIIHTEYIPEPILSEVAARKTESDEVFGACLDTLYESLQAGELSTISAVGDKGELAAAIAFTRLMDYAIMKKYDKSSRFYSYPVDLKTFLYGLFDAKADADDAKELAASSPLKEPSGLQLSGYVAFTKWTKIYVPISRKALLGAWNDRCAMICMDRQKAFDLVIPIVMREAIETPDQTDTFEAKEGNMSAILVQVKNLGSPWHKRDRERYFEKMNEWFDNNFDSNQLHINILIQMGIGGTGKREIEQINMVPNTKKHSWNITIPSIESLLFLPKSTRARISRISNIPNMEMAFTKSYQGTLSDRFYSKLVPYYRSFISEWRTVSYLQSGKEQELNGKELATSLKSTERVSKKRSPSKRSDVPESNEHAKSKPKRI